MKGYGYGVSVIVGTMLLVAGAYAGAPQSRAELENFVIQDCGSCHGLTMRGGLGPPLRPKDLEQLPAEAIAAIIREGVDGTAMPPWKALLTDEEILWISRQLKSGALITDETKDAR
ncbi:MAG: cytochrome c [Marinobacter sp.]|nr:cytochrome c [Marinobacter sp.]